MVAPLRAFAINQSEVLRVFLEVLVGRYGGVVGVSTGCGLDCLAVVVGLGRNGFARFIEDVDVIHRASVGIGESGLEVRVQVRSYVDILPSRHKFSVRSGQKPSDANVIFQQFDDRAVGPSGAHPVVGFGSRVVVTDQKQGPAFDPKTAAIPLEFVALDLCLLRQGGRADRDQAAGRKRLALDVHRQFCPAGFVDVLDQPVPGRLGPLPSFCRDDDRGGRLALPHDVERGRGVCGLQISWQQKSRPGQDKT
ncbi:MAG: hypothetical protein CM1200mP2_52450 [Planctomycetaceae bacterium]|nr:MAG: hypothetical protein CM1200mP2_52450 [Planctomycetaceae bacterium]